MTDPDGPDLDDAAPDDPTPDDPAPTEPPGDPGSAERDDHRVEQLLREAGTDLGSFIRHQRESARLSLRKLANMAGVSNPYLSQIERGLRNPSAEILQAIARALEISSETLYVRAGLLDEAEPDAGVEQAILRAPELTDAHKQALLEMYRSFRRIAELEQE